MVQLIQIRQRIKAIETIKKITHAMRLIAMSAHSRLKGQQKPLQKFHEKLSQIFDHAFSAYPAWHNRIFNPEHSGETLVIVIGSQKGLCGNFNNSLFYFFNESLPELNKKKCTYIAIGKKAQENLAKVHIKSQIYYKNFSAATLETISRSIIGTIMHAQPHFDSVIVFSNQLKTFFIQKPHQTILIPFSGQTHALKEQPGFYWQESPQEILDYAAQQLLVTRLQQTLFESLLAEQASRFISMDSSTRNANNLLDQTKLTYNKIRQANITKELSELSSSF